MWRVQDTRYYHLDYPSTYSRTTSAQEGRAQNGERERPVSRVLVLDTGLRWAVLPEMPRYREYFLYIALLRWIIFF